MTYDAVHAAFVRINENQMTTDYHIHYVRIHSNHDMNSSKSVTKYFYTKVITLRDTLINVKEF